MVLLARYILLVVLATAVTSFAFDYSNCEMCHKTGGPAPSPPWGLSSSPHAGIGCTECHPAATQAHSEGAPSVGCAVCHTDIVSHEVKRAHDFDRPGTAKCYSCHGYGHSVISAEKVMEQGDVEVSDTCSECHVDIVESYLGSAHGGAIETTQNTPTCFDCHGGYHTLMKIEDTPVLAPKNLPVFCGECHKGQKPTPKAPFTIPNPSEQLLESVHGQINEVTGEMNAGCYDCHETHFENPCWMVKSSTNFMDVSKTCGKCHREEYDLYSVSVHGMAAEAGVKDSPTCISCHGDHNVVAREVIEGKDGKERYTRIVETCSSCHFTQVLSSKFDIPENRVYSFEESYHGVVSSAGKLTAAECGSCHGVHKVLPSSNPMSSTHPDNLDETCGECHEDAGERFTHTPVHSIVVEEDHKNDPNFGGIIAVIYISLIVIVIGGMVAHNGLDYITKVRKLREKRLAGSKPISRLTPLERIQHVILLVSFTVLAISGFAIKNPSAWIFSWIVGLEGDFPLRLTVHKVFGVILILVSIFHLGYLIFTRRGRERFKAILPLPVQCVRDIIAFFKHRLGITDKEPDFDEFYYAEKAEYWALVWGNIIMGTTGIYMWLDPYIAQIIPWCPYCVYDIMRAVHFYEAILAVLAIIVWHLYFVIFDPFVYPMNFAWLDGKIPEDMVKKEKPAYYEKLKEDKKKGDDTESGGSTTEGS